jgi:mRNA interferase RelE/StbE
VSEYRTVFRPEAQAELRKVPRDMALRILAKLTELENDPLGFNTTALVSQPDRRRLRVGDYRVIYTIDNANPSDLYVCHVERRGVLSSAHTLKRNSTTSPSCMT